MSIVKVWDGTAWQSMDDKGPVGDQGVIGDKGPSTRISNCVSFAATVPNAADTVIYPTGLAVVSGSQGVQPCMVVSGTQLKAVKAGVYFISMRVSIGRNVGWDDGNYTVIERVVARDGETTLSSGDVPYGDFNSLCNTMAPLNANELVRFYVAKNAAGNADTSFTIRAVMMQ